MSAELENGGRICNTLNNKIHLKKSKGNKAAGRGGLFSGPKLFDLIQSCPSSPPRPPARPTPFAFGVYQGLIWGLEGCDEGGYISSPCSTLCLTSTARILSSFPTSSCTSPVCPWHPPSPPTPPPFLYFPGLCPCRVLCVCDRSWPQWVEYCKRELSSCSFALICVLSLGEIRLPLSSAAILYQPLFSLTALYPGLASARFQYSRYFPSLLLWCLALYRCERVPSIGYLSRAPQWGLNQPPGMCLDRETEPGTSWCMGRCSSH